MLEALRANVLAQRNLHVLVDNRAVVDGLQVSMRTLGQTSQFWLPKWMAGSWMEIRKALLRQPLPEIEWIPSHGKKAAWSTLSHAVTTAQCRKLNEAADKCAGTMSERQQTRYDRNGHSREYDEAVEETTRTLQRLHLAVLQYGEQYPEAVHPTVVEPIAKYM